jgi:hypothetical protein
MTKLHVQTFALALMLVVVGAAAGGARADGDAADTTLNDIAAYKQWARVTDKPLTVEFPSAGG